MRLKILKKLFYRIRKRLNSNVCLEIFEIEGGKSEVLLPNGLNAKVVSTQSELQSLQLKNCYCLGIVEKEIEKGSQILLFVENSIIVHFSCFTNKHMYAGEVRRTFCFPKGSLYIYNCYTKTSHRNRKLYFYALSIISGQSKGEVFIASLVENLGSIHIIKKVGFKSVGLIYYTSFMFFENVSSELLQTKIEIRH
ncbi:hypothetical protein N9W11_04920 [Psychrosphaera haliotis]|uniref:hypothetical protein n=1 Tax=Psychrosphaera haliotis TaxID=555083 RepID=UPI0023708EFE|nr:hypothetical protein [Psychrosphaera haliotis]